MLTEPVASMELDRPAGPISRVVGLYQTFLRRIFEHFFPEAVLDIESDRSIINWDGSPREAHFTVSDDPDGVGILIDWFRTRYVFQNSSRRPFLPAERRLIEIIIQSLDLRFSREGVLKPTWRRPPERFQYALEDVILTEYLDPPDPFRVPAVLESLRVAALSTYENRRVSMGTLLLGTPHDPLLPGWVNSEGAPRFNARLTAIKGFHRLCDGVSTVFVVDRQGDLMRTVDIERWAEKVHGNAPLDVPCPRLYLSHARATQGGGHVCLVLTPAQEIKVFAKGALAFAFSDARWRLLDIPTKFAGWCQAVGQVCPRGLAAKLFQAALNLSENRRGALFVVLRNPAFSIPQLIAPADRIIEEVVADDPHDPDNLSPRLAKRALHHAVRGQSLIDLDPTVLEAVAGIDGAVVTGTLLAASTPRRDPADRPRCAQGRPGGRRRTHPRRAGRLISWAGPQGQRGRLRDHVPGRPAGLGNVNECGS